MAHRARGLLFDTPGASPVIGRDRSDGLPAASWPISDHVTRSWPVITEYRNQSCLILFHAIPSILDGAHPTKFTSFRRAIFLRLLRITPCGIKGNRLQSWQLGSFRFFLRGPVLLSNL